MKLKIKATTPCVKYIKATPDAQLEKMLEEVLEVSDAWKIFEEEKNEENLLPLLMELLDVKACVNTAIAQIEYAVKQSNDARANQCRSGSMLFQSIDKMVDFKQCQKKAKREVIKKNMARGYYVLSDNARE